LPKVIRTKATTKKLRRSIKYLVLTLSFMRRNTSPKEQTPHQPQDDVSYRMTFQTVFLNVYQVR